MVFVDEAVGIELEEYLPIVTCLFVLWKHGSTGT